MLYSVYSRPLLWSLVSVRAGYWDVVPDLVIEVISPTDAQAMLRRKMADYLALGATVWLVDTEAQTVDVFEPHTLTVTYAKHDTLVGGHVLPDFTLDLRLVFGE